MGLPLRPSRTRSPDAFFWNVRKGLHPWLAMQPPLKAIRAGCGPRRWKFKVMNIPPSICSTLGAAAPGSGAGAWSEPKEVSHAEAVPPSTRRVPDESPAPGAETSPR